MELFADENTAALKVSGTAVRYETAEEEGYAHTYFSVKMQHCAVDRMRGPHWRQGVEQVCGKDRDLVLKGAELVAPKAIHGVELLL